jgi:hypothetical protein
MRAWNATQNGREAWLALIAHFEGDAQRDRVKDHAYASIASAFEAYVTIHQDAYSDLVQYGETISEEKRVRDLLQGIKDNAAATNAAKGTILATPTLRNNFANAVAHLSTTLQLSQSMQEPRSIGAISTVGRTGSDRGRVGRGRGRGRGRSIGRGRGRSIYLGSYSPEQRRQLSTEDKRKVIEGRQQSASNGNQNTNTRNHNNTNRNLSSITTNGAIDLDTHTVLTAPTTVTPQNIDQSILQGALQGSAAIGDKRNNTDSAGSHMSRRRINAIATSFQRTHARNISQTSYIRNNIEPFSRRHITGVHTTKCGQYTNPVNARDIQSARR